jgi:NADH:ubiquinone oxidoreductase subunit 5 (subunit L)/multisubunit Na+/H+ antiporter MnhA subunit
MSNTENTIMNYALFVIIPILVFLVFFFVKKANKKAEKSMDENNFVIREPKIYLWIGIICAVFFCGLFVLMCMFPNDTAEWWTYLVFSLFGISGICLVIYCVVWKLEIKDNQIIYTPFIGRKRSLIFDDIKKVKLKNGQKIVAYGDNNKKLFAVEFTSNGFNILVSRLKKERIYFEE